MSAKAKLKRATREVTEADAAATDGFGEHQDSWPVRLLDRIGGLGDQPELRTISCLTFVAGVLTRKPRLMRAGVRMLVAHEAATLAKDFVKKRVDRKRPRSAKTRDQAKPRPGRSQAKENTSFPSGHTAGAVAVAQAFAREFPEHRAPALAAAGVVALAQIPRCAHYPTDVGAGAIIGAAAEAVVGQIWHGEEGDGT
jgi:membrane-associated phospholipid phosphatase